MMPRAPDNIFGAAIIFAHQARGAHQQHTEQRDGVNVDGGGKNAAEVHGEERVNGRDWDCHDQIATHTGDGDNGFDG